MLGSQRYELTKALSGKRESDAFRSQWGPPIASWTTTILSRRTKTVCCQTDPSDKPLLNKGVGVVKKFVLIDT